MEKVQLYYLIMDCGDGSNRLSFYLSMEAAERAEEIGLQNGSYSSGEGSIDSYIGSREFAEAEYNIKELS